MRVLFTTWAWPSHYFPLVPLAWAMRAAGHEVRMASQPELATVMRESGLASVLVGRDFDVASAHRLAAQRLRSRPPAPSPAPAAAGMTQAGPEQPDGGGDRGGMSMFGQVASAMRDSRAAGSQKMSLFGDVAASMVDDLVEFARTWRPDLVVFDPLTFAGPIAAQVIGVPAVRHLFGPDVTYFTESLEAMLLEPMLHRFGLTDVNLQGVFTVDPCPPSLQFSPAVARVARLPMRYVPYNGLSEIAPWVWRERDRPRICLTWGTSTARLVGDDAFVPQPLLDACARVAGERGAELVLAITASQRGLLPPLPANVRVAESAPLQALLPTCEALIHQGGAGTMFTGLLAGLPQVVVTQLPDQTVNARNLAAAGAGRTMLVDAASQTAVGEALGAILDDPAHREAARRLNQEILDQPAPADLVDELVAVAGGLRPAAIAPPPAWNGDMFKMPFDEYIERLEAAAVAQQA